MNTMEPIIFNPIGHVETTVQTLPRHWTVSDAEGTLVMDAPYRKGLKDIAPGQRIIVLFHFHNSRPFSMDSLVQKPKHLNKAMGVFSICSQLRPNAVGLSMVTVLSVEECNIRVKGIDMMNGSPIIDIKPYHDKDGSWKTDGE